MLAKTKAFNHSWKNFFITQSFLVPSCWIFSSLMIWRLPTHTLIHPSFGRAVLLGTITILGSFLIAVNVRAISRSNNGNISTYVYFQDKTPDCPRSFSG
jgi:hypothetical protein